MRILCIHCRYKIRGGEEEVFEAEIDLLRQNGHIVDIYEDNNFRIDELSKANLVLKTIWSQEAYEAITTCLKKTTYDVVHVHNFFPLISPSVYYAAKAEGIPIVQTLHNYRLLCPNSLFFRQGKVCENCLGKPIPWAGAWHSCYRESQSASIATVGMLSLHRAMNTWNNLVDRYIVLTEFAKQKFIQGGLPAAKIVVKPNFVTLNPQIGSGTGGYFLYVGRLSVEKGIDVLLTAWEELDYKVPLKIVGDGPLSERVIEATQRSRQIEWLGKQPLDRVYELMGGAIAVIIPSQWYETFGRVAIEAFAKGTPVIASKIGALAELVDSERIGLLFNPGDARDLADKVQGMRDCQKQLALMRTESRKEYTAKYTAEINYQQLMAIYQSLSK